MRLTGERSADEGGAVDPHVLIDRIRLSKTAKTQLSRLKRRTGIEHWNTLCRWGLCISLAEPSKPRDIEESTLEGIEIDWRTFTGGDDLLYATLIRERCLADGFADEPDVLARQLRLHVHRGIAYLFG